MSLEVRVWRKDNDGRTVELVSDDRNGENMIVADALAEFGLNDLADRWNIAPFEDGELVVKLEDKEIRPTSQALMEADYCWDASNTLAELAEEE